jgi:hypothetical protein
MTERDQAVMRPLNGANHRRQGAMPALNEFNVAGDQPVDEAVGLVSLAYIWAAIKRRKRLPLTLAVVGLLLGLGVFHKFPPAYEAQTSVYLTYGANEDPYSAVLDAQIIAQSRTVAQLAADSLGDHQSAASFEKSYTVLVLSNSVLEITAKGSSPAVAVSHASAVATQFLKLRDQMEENAEHVLVKSLQRELSADRKNLASLDSLIAKTKSESASPARQAELSGLAEEKTDATTALGSLQTALATDETGSETLPSVDGSVVLDPAALVVKSRVKEIGEYSLYGLVGGSALGLGIVVIAALGTDRLRRRDDVARALGAPVRLSVGGARLGRSLRRRGLAGARDGDIQQIVAHLREVVPQGEGRLNLAIVPVDDPSTAVAAVSAVSLAEQYARSGARVIVADLASGVPAAALLGNREPGVRMVGLGESRVTLAVPEPDEFAPRGPFSRNSAGRSRFTAAVSSAFGSADVLITLVTLDPAVGGEHLATWASKAVAVVTAGESSWTRLQSAGEMVRMGGPSLVSAVLVGADKSDWSLGLMPDPDAPAGVAGTA